MEIRNALVDLSLNYHNVNYLEHSSFFKSKNDVDEFTESESDHKRIFEFKSKEINFVKNADEINNQKMIEQPVFIFKMALIQESKEFFQTIN